MIQQLGAGHGPIKNRIAVVQSNYIPWKGYFDIINSVDEFILFDTTQYTIRDWRNRNRIKTRGGLTWLTIPVEIKGKRLQNICDVTIADPGWNRRHWRAVTHNYSKAKCFRAYRDAFEHLYLGSDEKSLSQVNYRFLKGICDILGIRTKLSWSMDYDLVEGKTERLIHLCKQADATEYLSGPTAKGYIDEQQLEKEGIILRYMDYTGYPEYEQLFPPFEHRVSIIDLILNEGPDARNYMKSF